MAAKVRADVALVDRGLVESRAKAQALIMAGVVFSGETKILKAGQQIKDGQALEVRGKEHDWVSRGGLKLEKGLKEFGVDPTGLVAIDVGASTGGFTDVLLQGGAQKVYAVDVGHGQLAWKLRQDDRVVVMEKTNARYLDAEAIPDPIDIVVCDASFISLKTVLPAAMALVKPGGRLIALIKPQFEVGRENVGKGGVVRDPELHTAVCADMQAWLNDEMDGWTACGLTESPIKGPEGNIEFLLYGEKA
ncbi:TlyA family RNA methyltransferase [Kordiimonas lacus]|uniref:23S rRNA (Cytidine1920-2'-O)/16S rRNA (Cytidine1409-2'-O)-methyltransferase n=1 Tax=Kordiimonas lacus TaxID=637679 RepID=A0A1G7CH04_9PROT|nr:TlyA family RNA methyltransferase [Kordiimonas lacus]SDE38010.1 23S rRNA (cytidine1920-2'-O)/16S rRNA (cytidine1409-2'-O)-methyltransferase [Kordiimonas lacus]